MNSTERVKKPGKMDRVTRDHMLMGRSMAKEHSNGQMEANTLAILKKTCKMDLEFIHGMTVESMKANG